MSERAIEAALKAQFNSRLRGPDCGKTFFESEIPTLAREIAAALAAAQRVAWLELPEGKYVMFTESGAGHPCRIVIQFQDLADMQRAHGSLLAALAAGKTTSPFYKTLNEEAAGEHCDLDYRPDPPLLPHDYNPSAMHQGDCLHCGNLQDHPIHNPVSPGKDWKRGDHVQFGSETGTLNAPTNEKNPTGLWWVEIPGEAGLRAVDEDMFTRVSPGKVEADMHCQWCGHWHSSVLGSGGCPPKPPRVRGVSRLWDNEKALMLSLDRRPTDDELRAIHDYLNPSPPLSSRAEDS